jgi:hypothetical protein
MTFGQRIKKKGFVLGGLATALLAAPLPMFWWGRNIWGLEFWLGWALIGLTLVAAGVELGSPPISRPNRTVAILVSIMFAIMSLLMLIFNADGAHPLWGAYLEWAALAYTLGAITRRSRASAREKMAAQRGPRASEAQRDRSPEPKAAIQDQETPRSS